MSVSPEGQQILKEANQIAIKLRRDSVDTRDLLEALTKPDTSIGRTILQKLGIPWSNVENLLFSLAVDGDATNKGTLPLSPHVERVIQGAIDEARNTWVTFAQPQHLFLGTAGEPDGTGGAILQKVGVQLPESRRVVASLTHDAFL